jgi:hypothetical protein
MNRYLELSKALSEAWVEYQGKFDALKKFDEGLLMPNVITDVEKTLAERDRLEIEERNAYEKRKEAEKAYKEYLRSKEYLQSKEQ